MAALPGTCQEQRQGEELRQKQMRDEQRLGELEGLIGSGNPMCYAR